MFRTGGRLPVYGALSSIDGTNFSPDAMWGTGDAGGAYAPEGERRGRMWFLEGGDLAPIPADSYDAVLSAHVIEHLADPIGALGEWARVVRPGGHLLLVAPHKERTIDHRRPVTAVSHMIEDHGRGVGEDDATHVQEVLELHDLARDDGVSDREEFERRTRDNPTHRAVHHHVFTTRSLLQLLDRCDLCIQAVAARLPGDVFVLAQVLADGEAADNAAWLVPRARPLRRSPFRLDRSGVGAPDLE